MNPDWVTEGEDERRSVPRTEIVLAVQVQRLGATEAPIEAETKNLSATGAFIVAEQALALGCPLALTLEATGLAPMTLDAEVVRLLESCKKQSGVYKVLQSGFAVRFRGNKQRRLTQFSSWLRQLAQLDQAARLEDDE